MGLVEHAERELALLSNGEPDDMQKMMNRHLLKMVRLFDAEGHSGFSAGYAINVLERLLRFEPLKPLTGEDDEWCEVRPGHFQNRRCSHVFKEADGRAYDSEGRIFREPNGRCYTSKDSFVYIEFPYTPKREYVDVPGEEAEEGSAQPGTSNGEG